MNSALQIIFVYLILLTYGLIQGPDMLFLVPSHYLI